VPNDLNITLAEALEREEGVRIGVLGGSFDPIHHGHLAAAQESAWALGLERVLFVPVCRQPLKDAAPMGEAQHRAAMVGLAIAANPLFELSTVDLDRGGVSYTVDTLRALNAVYPAAELYFILGMDALKDLPRWRDPTEIVGLARIAAVTRGGWEAVDTQGVESELPAAAGRVERVSMPGLDISASDLRQRVQEGRPIRYLVPDAVAAYIEEHGLYR
jgi:nicotinate-nucleotide adenylyltransferase